MDWMTAAGNTPFSIALLIMVGLALVELLALVTGFSVNDVVDDFVAGHLEATAGSGTGMEATGHGEGSSVVGRFLAWLHIGRVPVLMILIVFLTTFGLVGLVGQGIVHAVLGRTLPALLAAPAALLAALPAVRAVTGVLARLMPREETSAVDVATLVGRTAVVTGGTARSGMPAQARVRDSFGTEHYVLVEPEDEGVAFATGTVVLLVRQQAGGRFTVIDNPNAALVDH